MSARAPHPLAAPASFVGRVSSSAENPTGVAPRNCLPRDLPDFTGRENELARLAASADDRATVYTVDGMAGVGKTAFAVHAGHLLADRFPDGALFVDLQGHSAGKMPLTADEALDVLLGQLAIAVTGDAKAQWRAKTAALRLLIIFDNAVDETQVAPLLPAGPSLVIVTSRARLPNLAGAQPLSLVVLPSRSGPVFAWSEVSLEPFGSPRQFRLDHLLGDEHRRIRLPWSGRGSRCSSSRPAPSFSVHCGRPGSHKLDRNHHIR